VYELTKLRRQEVSEIAPSVIAVLPIGSHEQHGGHLPLGTDTMLVEAVAQRALHDRTDVVLCPTLPYGFSEHHQFSSALSLQPDTLLTVLSQLIDSLVKARFRRILLLNGHGGNVEMMSQSVKLAALHYPIIAASCSYWDLVAPSPETPGHAGRFETDLMSAVYPDAVEPRGTGPAEQPLFDRTIIPGLHIERHGEWARSGGVTDSPGNGDETKGKTILTTVAEALESCIEALLNTPLPPVPATGAEDTSNEHRS
jgi:creatinine amidohydrolase